MNVFGEAIVDVVPANQMISERMVRPFLLLVSPHFFLPPHFSAPSLHFSVCVFTYTDPAYQLHNLSTTLLPQTS
jgi:hypothetical protein